MNGSVSELPLCAAKMMTGCFNAVLAKIKGLSDKYQGRLRDCSESHSELLTIRAGTQVGVGFLGFLRFEELLRNPE